MQQPATTSPVPPIAVQIKPIAQAVPNVVASDHSQGPHHVGGQSFTFVKHVQGIEGKGSGDDSTVEGGEFHDASCNVIYGRQHPVTFDNGSFTDTDQIDAR